MALTQLPTNYNSIPLNYNRSGVDPLPAFPLPAVALDFSKPNEEISEFEKWAEDGLFFTRMARWITLNFFNQNVQKFYHNDNSLTRYNEDMIENFAYYFGRQQNKTFGYTETINERDTIQAVYVPDQKIRQLVDHMIGNTIKMIQPIKDSLSAKVLSHDAIKGKEELRKKLEVKKALKELLAQAQGVTFAPGGIDNIDEDEDIDDVMAKFKDEEEIKFIRLAQSLYFMNKCAKTFEQSAFHEFIGNVSTFDVQNINGNTEINFYPCYNSIVDYRATDDFLSDALLSGFVEFLSPAEIFSKWGEDLTQEKKDHINRMSMRAYENWQECYTYYNGGCSNLTWWCQETGKVSCATTYWIGKKGLPYRKKKNQFGKDKIQFLDDNTDYAVSDEYGKPIKDETGKHKTVKGSEIKSDKSIWMVHKTTLIGNYCSVNKGYHGVQIRPQGQKQKPLLSTVQFVHRLTMGYARSVASRLRHYSDEKGRLKLKIQELTGRDMGKVYALFADKMGLADNETQEIFKDFKTMGFSLFNKTGDNENEDGRLTADVLDFSLQPSIGQYIELCREQDREMESMISLSSTALGLQTRTVGKSVQETSIAQSSLGQLSLYDGLGEHWRQVLSYALNVDKTVSAGKEKIVQTSETEAFLININKNLMYQDIGLWIEYDDGIDGEQRKVLMDGLFSYNQNGGQPQAAEALLNTMHLISFNSTVEGIKHLDKFVSKQKKEAIAQAQAQTQGEMQHEADLQTAAKMFEAALQKDKDLNANFRTEVTATMAALSKMHSDIEKGNTAILQMLSQMQPVTPIDQILQPPQPVQGQQEQETAQEQASPTEQPESIEQSQ